MKSLTAAGIAVRFSLAGMLACVLTARAQESDEILNLQRMADQEMLAPASEPIAPPAVQVSAEAVTAGQADLASQLRSKEFELQRAQNEIARLQRALADQEAQHEAELQSSYYNMGCVYKAAKQFERAEAEFLKVLAINPNDAGAHYNLAILYDDDLHQKDKARTHYLKFLELAPDDRDVSLVKEWLAELK
ncbi:MAG: tetratricopeptide repeat protein [Lentisphaerae bacterium]|nr:tetratricopeptide repeat protein [Lentisphaerota bacterium]